MTAIGGWPDTLRAYRAHQLGLNRSPGTIRLHYYYLSRLAAVVPVPAMVTLDHLEAVTAAPHWKAETRKSARCVYRGFFGWAHRTGRVPHNPASLLFSVRVPTGVPRPAPEDVIAAAVAAGDDRVRMMVWLAAYCGLRCAEISQLNAADLAGDRLLVHGKGRKDREVLVVYPPLLAALNTVPEEWVFPNGRGDHLTPGHVTRLLSRALPGGWTGHTLRHRMATVAYAGTRDLLAVGAVLGHSRPETTQRYVAMPKDAVRAAMLAAAS